MNGFKLHADVNDLGLPLSTSILPTIMIKMRSERFFKNDILPFAEVRYSKGSTVPFKLHMHRTLSIGGVDRGIVQYQVGEQKATLEPGSLAVMNPDTLHACNPINEMGRSYYMLYLDPSWCIRVQQSMWEVSSFIKLEKIRIDDKPLYSRYCMTMQHLMDDKIHLQEKEQLLFDLACDVFSLSCSPQKEQAEDNKDLAQLKRVLGDELQQDLPINSLAREFSSNPYTLIRRFKKVTGITPHAYRMNCRIEQAKEFLRQGRDITETALDCGFFDQSHFHRHFKAMTTVTPQEYRVNFIQ